MIYKNSRLKKQALTFPLGRTVGKIAVGMAETDQPSAEVEVLKIGFLDVLLVTFIAVFFFRAFKRAWQAQGIGSALSFTAWKKST